MHTLNAQQHLLYQPFNVRGLFLSTCLSYQPGIRCHQAPLTLSLSPWACFAAPCPSQEGDLALLRTWVEGRKDRGSRV